VRCLTVKLQSSAFFRPQHPTQHLPENRLRQFRAELYVLWHFVRRQIVPAVCEQIIHTDRFNLQDDKRLDRFASVCDLYADYGGFAHERMEEKDVLNL
jgi:hypothetical protein